jgi:ribosomal protein L22
VSPQLPRRRRKNEDEEPKAAAQEPEEEQAQPATEEQPAPSEPAVEPIPQVEAQPAPIRRGRVAVTAKARYVRSTPRKARVVSELIRGRTVEEARELLRFSNRAVARDWAKLLESAVANARHNYALEPDQLVVDEAYADGGPTLKRYRPRAMGRAYPILKRTAHLTITLTTER